MAHRSITTYKSPYMGLLKHTPLYWTYWRQHGLSVESCFPFLASSQTLGYFSTGGGKGDNYCYFYNIKNVAKRTFRVVVMNLYLTCPHMLPRNSSVAVCTTLAAGHSGCIYTDSGVRTAGILNGSWCASTCDLWAAHSQKHTFTYWISVR